jgi:hypothetical protein
VKDENGKSVLCVELLKALCGTLKAALLFWGFEINPYDWCVANKMINGKQCTILWHVDDLKTSHVDPEVNAEIVKLINDEFGKEAPITVTRGKTHDYLGMTLDCTEKGKVKIKMIDCVEKMLADLPEDLQLITYLQWTMTVPKLMRRRHSFFTRTPPNHCSYASEQGLTHRQP